MIPARGTVEFIVFSLDRDGEQPDIIINGADCWRRPVVGLIQQDWDGDCPWMSYEPVVVDECGLLCTAYDYMQELMGDNHWDHTHHTYQPHIDGPVSDAPRIKVVAGSAVTA